MSSRPSVLYCALLAFITLVASGCASTQPVLSEGASPRVSAASFYREAPWTKTSPTNIKAVGNALVATTQGLADISSTYSQQLALQNQAQMKLLNDPSPYESRAAVVTECVNVGGGRQGGMQCERLGFAAYDKEYGSEAKNPAALRDLEITNMDSVRSLGGWGGTSAADFENWKAGHEFGQLMIEVGRDWEQAGKDKMNRGR